MKTSFLLLAVAAMFLTGCGNSNSDNTSAPATNNYLGTLMNADKSMQNQIDTTSLNQAIQQFNVQEGRYPKDLNELVDKQYIPKIPDAPYGYKINYDASSGQVTVVKTD